MLLCEAPLVEGAVAAAAARARGGATLEEARAEARRGAGRQGGPPRRAGRTPRRRRGRRGRAGVDGADAEGDSGRRRARPARAPGGARSCAPPRGLDAEVRLDERDAAGARRCARSLTALVALGALRGPHGADPRAAARRPPPPWRPCAPSWDEDAATRTGRGAPAAAAPAAAPAGSRRRRPRAGDGAAGSRPRPASAGPARRLAGGRAAPGARRRPPATRRASGRRLDAALAAPRGRSVRDRAGAGAERAGEAEAEIFDAQVLLLDDAELVGRAPRAIDGRRAARRGLGRGRARRPRRPTRASTTRTCVRGRPTCATWPARARRLAGETAAAGTAEPGILVARRDHARPRRPTSTRGSSRASRRPRGGADLARGDHRPRARHPRSGRARAGASLGVDAGRRCCSTATPDASWSTPAGSSPSARPRGEADERRARGAARARREPARHARRRAASRWPRTSASAEDAAEAVELGADGRRPAAHRVPLPRPRHGARPRTSSAPPTRRSPRALDGRPLIMRTLDAGADKPLPFLRQAPEENPFLGVRGMRLGARAARAARARSCARSSRVAAEHPVA